MPMYPVKHMRSQHKHRTDLDLRSGSVATLQVCQLWTKVILWPLPYITSRAHVRASSASIMSLSELVLRRKKSRPFANARDSLAIYEYKPKGVYLWTSLSFGS